MSAHATRRRACLTVAAPLVALISIGLGACGGDRGADGAHGGEGRLPRAHGSDARARFVPNAVHAGIYRSAADGCYEDENVDLEVVEPTSTADTLKLIDAGKADVGYADAIDVAGQVDEGRGAKAIMAIVQRPLGAPIVLADSGITDPADLEGRAVGVTGVPSDDAVLDTVVAGAGGDPSALDRVTIGFNGVQDLENGSIDAFTGYVAADATQIELDGFPVISFPLDEYGGPRYPGLVMFSTEIRIAEAPELLGAIVACTAVGYERTIDDPDASLRDLVREVPALDEELAAAQLDAYLPLFQAKAPEYGAFDEGDLSSLSAFLVENGLAGAPIAPDRYATNQFIPGAGRKPGG